MTKFLRVALLAGAAMLSTGSIANAQMDKPVAEAATTTRTTVTPNTMTTPNGVTTSKAMTVPTATPAANEAPDHGIWLILPLTIADGQNAAWEAFFSDMRAKVAAEEPGTLRFDLFRVKGQPHRYTVIEHYADQAAWDQHTRLQGERGVVPRMAAFQAAPPDFQFLEAVGGSLR